MIILSILVIGGGFALGAICLAGLAAIFVWRARRVAAGPSSGILVYHRVERGLVLGSTWIGARGFRRQMEFLARSGRHCVDVQRQAAAGARGAFALTFDDALLCLYDNALPILDSLGMKATFFVVSGYIGRLSHWDVYKRPHMDEGQIADLLRRGHQIGSHTVTHPDLRRLSDSDLCRELEQSKADLQDRFGVEISLLAYPFGYYDNRVAQAAVCAGYRYALTINHARHPGPLPAMAIPANAVYVFDSLADLEAKAGGNSLFWMQELKSKLLNQFTSGTPLVVNRPDYRRD